MDEDEWLVDETAAPDFELHARTGAVTVRRALFVARRRRGHPLELRLAACVSRGRSRRVGRRPGPLLGDARSPVREPAAAEEEGSAEPPQTLGLDVGRIEAELEGHAYEPRVRNDFLSGVRSGVNGTPTFFINGMCHNGSYDLDTLLAALRAAV
jgi:hypothetical protein